MWTLWNTIYFRKNSFVQFYELRSERGISIDADSGPPRYLLWCCGGICHELLTFIQIGCGHTVLVATNLSMRCTVYSAHGNFILPFITKGSSFLNCPIVYWIEYFLLLSWKLQNPHYQAYYMMMIMTTFTTKFLVGNAREKKIALCIISPRPFTQKKL